MSLAIQRYSDYVLIYIFFYVKFQIEAAFNTKTHI